MKKAIITFPKGFTTEISIKDLPLDCQEKYEQYLKGDKFIYINSNAAPKDYKIWKKYGIDDDLSIKPYIDIWLWKSSDGLIILRDMYVINSSYMLVGAIFFVIEDKYTIACYNDGRKLIKVQDDEYYSEFNFQLEMFNYLRAKRRYC